MRSTRTRLALTLRVFAIARIRFATTDGRETLCRTAAARLMSRRYTNLHRCAPLVTRFHVGSEIVGLAEVRATLGTAGVLLERGPEAVEGHVQRQYVLRLRTAIEPAVQRRPSRFMRSWRALSRSLGASSMVSAVLTSPSRS